MLASTCTRITAFLCATWMLVWVIWGSSAAGHEWYLDNVGRPLSSDEPKSMLPIAVLALPVLISGTVAAATLTIQQTSRAAATSSTSYNLPSLPHSCPSGIHQLLAFGREPRLGQVKRIYVFVIFFLLPILCLIGFHIQRHMVSLSQRDNDDLLTDKIIMEVSNSFGFGALVFLNLQLIPVARFSPLLTLVGWSSARATFIHVWMGRFIVFFVLIHGLLHSYRWTALENESFWHMSTIPRSCWKDWDHYEDLVCNYGSECSCDDHLRNLTGVLAGVAFLVIGLASMDSVRRKFYSIFLSIHLIAGPICLLTVIFHYHRAIMYLAGGMLYYLASSLPVFVENRVKRDAMDQVPVISAQSLGEDRSCVSLTIQASPVAIERFRPGQYVKVLVPEISSLAHPFTINQVVSSSDHEMRIIFREMGTFTKALRSRLFDQPATPPAMYMEGFLGENHRLADLLEHDAVLIVAGGIGITPYLSLLQQASQANARGTGLRKQRSIHLHWITRDQQLMDYVMEEYLTPICSATGGDFEINCTIHFTGGDASAVIDMDVEEAGDILRTNSSDSSSYGSCDSNDQNGLFIKYENPVTAQPFKPSKFAVGSKTSLKGNFPALASFVIIGFFGLVTIWVCCVNMEMGYFVAMVPVFMLAIFVAVFLNFVMPDHGGPLMVQSDEASALNSSYHGLQMVPSDNAQEDNIEASEEKVNPTDLSKDNTAPLDEDVDGDRLQVSHGRPFMATILSEANLDDAARPAVFSCGPDVLMKSLRKSVESRLSLYSRCCGRVAIYEESFEL